MIGSRWPANRRLTRSSRSWTSSASGSTSSDDGRLRASPTPVPGADGSGAAPATTQAARVVPATR